MAEKDLHDRPFDDATIAKLEIFESYAQAWIPTFVTKEQNTICIFDFFAGTGYDLNGMPGSPIRIFKKIREQILYVFKNKVKVIVFLNEFKKKKYDRLKAACEEYFNENKDLGRAIEVKYYNENFETCFDTLLPYIKHYPSLVYLDQNGVKFISEDYLLKLNGINKTDFLYFVSSSYTWRFGGSKEFQEHLNLDMEGLKKRPYQYIHVSLLNQIKGKLPKESNLKLYPFSIKKGSNIYGIVFGASHPRAVDKFLQVAWKKNNINGQANFDIEDQQKKGQLNLFEEIPLNKIKSFQNKLREKILNGEIKSNVEAYVFTLEEGHIGTHAREVIMEMKRDKLLFYAGTSPLITYEKTFGKEKQVLPYDLLKQAIHQR